jgi:hypothetical protein
LDQAKQLIYAEVYSPMSLDSGNEFMRADQIEAMAHRFLANQRGAQIDVEHDNGLVDAVVVESFIARAGDPLFTAGAWVVAIHLKDAALWQMALDGDINGLSMEAMVVRQESQLDIEVPEYIVGETSDELDHVHTYTVRFDDEGNFLGGETNEVNGHFHRIMRGTVTQDAGSPAHRHKYLLELPQQ